MSSYKLFLTSSVDNARIKRTMPRKRIHGTPVFVSGKLLTNIPDPVDDRLRKIKRELGGIVVERSFMYVFGEKVILSVEDTKEAVKMGITVEREFIVIRRK